jgi:hypothetical protein
MNQRTLGRDSPEYCIAAGRLGMDRLLEHPFKPFVIVFADMCADRSAPRIAYKILNPRAINLEKFGAGYKIGLAINEETGVKDIYLSIAVERILWVYEIDIPSSFQDVWCTWSEIDPEEDYGY